MSFLQTISDDEATGDVAEIYRRQREASGYVPESTRVLTTRPDVLGAYTRFIDAVRGGFTLPMRDWRLITLVAARHIPSTYCSLAYGKGLLADLGSPEVKGKVEADSQEASTLGVNGTPGFFINGRYLSGAQPFAAFKQIIDEEIAKGG